MQSAGVSRFIRRRITRIGFGLTGVFIIAIAMTAGKPVTSLFQILAIIGLTLIFSLVWILFRSAKIEVNRTLPAFGSVGLPVRYQVSIKNVGKKHLSDAWLMENTPDPRPTFAVFASAREPGENKRNAFDRVFRFYRWMWLIEQLETLDDSTAKQPINLAPGESQTLSMEWTPKRRGIVTLEEMRVLLPDPFGLFQRCRKIAAPEAKMVVYPERLPLDQPNLAGTNSETSGLERSASRNGSSEEFTSLRDYFPGDPVRHIHWKSWARTGRPIVKEYEDSRQSRMSLFIDTFPNQAENPEVFENTLKIAAGFVVSETQPDTLLDSIITAQESFETIAENQDKRIEQCMTFLAGLYPGDTGNEHSVLANIINRKHSRIRTKSIICLFSHWDTTRANLAKELLKTGITLRLIGIDISAESLIKNPINTRIEQINTENLTTPANAT